MKKIAVIGAGLTGLSVCYFLEEKLQDRPEVEIHLIEKNGRVGGVVATLQRDGFVIEGGPDCFISEKPAPALMAKKLGFEEDLCNTNEENKGTFVYSNGRLHLLPEGTVMMVPTKFLSFATTGLFSWPGKLRIALDLFIPRRKENSEESLASFVRRRLGEEALDKLAEPLIAGIHGANPETMSLRATFPRFIEMEEKYGSLILGFIQSRKRLKEFERKNKESGKPKMSFFVTFRHGMQELTDGLANSLKRTQVRLNTSVVSIDKMKNDYLLTFADGQTEEFDALIVTTPAYSAAKLFRKVEPRVCELLSQIPYSPSATVSFAFKKEELGHDLKGFGFVVPASAKKNILAGTWVSSKFPFRAPVGYALIRAFIGGARNPEMVNLDEKDLKDIALKDLKEIMKIQAEPLFYEVFRWQRSMPQYTLGHLERTQEIMKRVEKIPGLCLVGSAYVGVGIGDCIKQGEKGAETVIKWVFGNSS